MMKTGLALALVVGIVGSAGAMDLVKDGAPATVIVWARPEKPAVDRRGRPLPPADEQAAKVLVDWIGKITDARLPLTETPPANGAALFVGRAAVVAGLKLGDIASPSHEGLRVVCDGKRVLLGGQNDDSTLKAACRFLEELGCRYLLDHPLGEAYPRTKTLSVGKLDITEKPGFLFRSIWGSTWSGNNLWKVWNGAGGLPLNTGHSWGRYVDAKAEFPKHPEWFALRDGQRKAGGWYCTSNPGVRQAFTEGVLKVIESGVQYPSLSPEDGRGYCQCDACRAQDDPNSLEPSSGTVNVTNRYLDFYQAVAARIAKEHPDAILNFYCYADYTQPPTSGIRLQSNLCAWIAPIRYCRLHRIGQPGCESREQLEDALTKWSQAASKIAYRTYNYNLAECMVPFSMISIWSHDIPYLKSKGCIGINLESLRNWQIYGPHMYLSIRLAYAPEADAKAIMDDYFLKLYGPKAGPLIQQYWQEIDDAFANLKSHAGSYYNVHLVYTPEFLEKLQGLLDRAAAAVKDQPQYAARLEMNADGWKNALQYTTLRDAMNKGDAATMKKTYDDLLARSLEYAKGGGLGQAYTAGYLKRFVGGQVEAAHTAASAPNKLLAVLPDEMRLAYDEEGKGVELGYAKPDFNDTAWQRVRAFSTTLDAQGLPDRRTVQWFRGTFRVEPQGRKLALVVLEVDGNAVVYLNGKEVGKSDKKRKPFQVDLTDAVKAGENTLAVSVDHSSITELFLGGILRPIYLVEKGE